MNPNVITAEDAQRVAQQVKEPLKSLAAGQAMTLGEAAESCNWSYPVSVDT